MIDSYKYGETFFNNILTSYRVYGDVDSPLTPLIILHGGPSGGFDYLLNYHQLADKGRMVIFYDQFGCGRSTHFPTVNPEFWSIDRYLSQLQHLINHLRINERYTLLGHSWGGMLAAEHACLQPYGLKGMILASSPASIPLWREEALRLFKEMTEVTEDFIDNILMNAKIYQNPPQELADYYAKHVYTLTKESKHIQHSNAQFAADPTGYHVLWGANEIAVNGTLSQWDITNFLYRIRCPSLILNGEKDQATLKVVQPLIDNIPVCQLVTIPDSSHNPHEENIVPCVTVVNEFLQGID